jgi:hypothetical protein
MDLIGFGFDNYDATGAWITTEGGTTPTNGTAVNASGSFVSMGGPHGLSGAFSSPSDMITQLAASDQARECFALQQMRYAFGRVEAAGDSCSAQQAYAAFKTGNFNVKQLLVAIVSSDSFRYRSAVNAGKACQ